MDSYDEVFNLNSNNYIDFILQSRTVVRKVLGFLKFDKNL